MVTTDQVRAALAELPDPELPVVSLVDLGVIGDISVDGDTVHVELRPTFLGCPALDLMRAQLADAITGLGAEPEVQVVTDGWSTDRITPEGHAKLRAAGVAPPAPHAAGTPTLLQLESKAFRCPYCGSNDTRLENIFGATPCRSLRWCAGCRQPFEQFKTV